jgi:asparaginyl-tRNA synthetase
LICAQVTWGIDLDSEHERYLTEKVYKGPVVLINYPKDIKAFYMKLNADGKTVAACVEINQCVGCTTILH